MWNSNTLYPFSDRELIAEAISHLNELVFDHWLFPPKVTIGEIYQEDIEDEVEFELCVEYENKNGDDRSDTFEGHEAFNLVQAFIAGVLFQDKRH